MSALDLDDEKVREEVVAVVQFLLFDLPLAVIKNILLARDDVAGIEIMTKEDLLEMQRESDWQPNYTMKDKD